MKTGKLLTLLILISFASHAQKHKATKAEADYYNQFQVLYSSMPEKFRGGSMDDFGARPSEISEGDQMQDCKSLDCYMLLATANYGFAYKNADAVALKSQINAIKGTDAASLKKKDQLEYKLTNEYGLSIKLMANFVSGEYFLYCKGSNYQKLTPPAGWDGWYMGSMANCPDFSGVQSADASFVFMGSAPEVKETARPETTKGVPTFPINPSDINQFKVKNVVLYIQGSKELVAEFVKNMDTASLRGLIAK
ncbi:MAG: hypothetical protein JST46_10545 [Bacteroidetes bacterium]|nr:hypothetical protein [Bacteroidota bacterium]